jgi:predicted flap endonuclease-1-like 5' DNA nuclease
MSDHASPQLDQSDLPANLSQPARRALTEAGLTRLDQIAGRSTQELLRLHGVGPKAIRLLKEALAERGMSFSTASAEQR